MTTPSSISLTNQPNNKTVTTNPPILSIQSTNQGIHQQQQVVTIPNNSSLTQVLRQFTTSNSNININTVNVNANTIHQSSSMPSVAISEQAAVVSSTSNEKAGDASQPNSSAMNNSNENITFID